MMDKGCGGGDDLGDGMQCSNHPYGSSPGGICAFCLQEKLGKLVSSSKSNSSFFPISSSSSASPSFRSAEGGGRRGGGLGFPNIAASSSSSLSLSVSRSVVPSSSCNNNRACSGRIPFPVAPQNKIKANKKVVEEVNSNSNSGKAVLKRSKSSAAPRRGHNHLLDAPDECYSPRKRGFWSFFHLPSSSTSSSSSSRNRRGSYCRDKGGDSKPSIHPTPSAINTTSTTSISSNALVAQQNNKDKNNVGESSSSRRGGDYGDENESPNSSSGHASSFSFGRKVARSRSLGCGSRSFSGDFLERISTGFGDCTVLRRVESQREAKQVAASKASVVLRGNEDHHRMKERVKCGGIFGGFSMTLTSSSYWASTTTEHMNNNSHHHHHHCGSGGGNKGGPASSCSSATNTIPHGRSKSWGWAFASPMRAFRPSSSSSSSSKPDEDYNKDSSGNNASKRSTSTATTNYQLQQHIKKKNTDHNAGSDAGAAVPVPNLAAIPSLLTVRS